MRHMRLIGLILLWIFFLGLVGYLGHLSLKACGLRIWGYEMNWCSAKSAPDLSRLNALQGELTMLMGMAAEEKGQCPKPQSDPQPEPEPEPEPEPVPPVVQAPPPSEPDPEKPDEPKLCASVEDRSYVVLVLDQSFSMGLPADMDSALATKLEKREEAGGLLGKAAGALYSKLIRQPGRKRLDELKDAVAQVAQQVDPQTVIGAVSFAKRPVDMGDFDQTVRDRLIKKTRALTLKSSTAAGAALKLALKKVKKRGGGRIILVSDGKDTEHGDPCGVARAHPEVEIDVISLGGEDALACVAKATGGKWIEPDEVGPNLQKIMVGLGKSGVRQQCEE